MAEVKEIITDLHALNERSDEINVISENTLMREIVSNLKKTMKAKNIRALSAPAIGYNKRIFCVDFEDNEIKTFINPIIAKAEGIALSREQCTSIPGKTYIRPRNSKVTVIYQRPLGQTENREFLGMAASVIQHEIDHLDGMILPIIGLEIDEDFDKASEEERQEVIEMYMESLDMRTNEINKEIEEDPELKQMTDAINFMTEVQTGKITLEKIEEKS